jgi:broad specificity phosphatase PhoE
MLPTIYLIRHGETEWSRLGRHTSHSDIALTARGQEEAAAVRRRLAGVTFSHVVSSPRLRALRTREIAGLGQAVEIEPGVREWEYGDYEGLRSEEILRSNPAWNIYRDGCPHGELPAQIAARADDVAARLRAREGNVAVVSHGHFLRVLAVRWIGLPIEVAQYFALGTASLGILGFERESLDRPVIALWNEKPVIPQ